MVEDFKGKSNLKVGVISDTHGLLRPEAIDAMHGADLIIHAGDIGSPGLLIELGNTAPVIAVRGNMDYGFRAGRLPLTEAVTLSGNPVYVLHDINCLDLDPEASGIRAVISGHTHMPSIKKQGRVLYLNPGSAGSRRHSGPVSVALLHIKGYSLDAELIRLPV